MSNPIEIKKGTKIDFKILFQRSDSNNRPLDLTGYSEITVTLPNADGSDLDLTAGGSDISIVGDAMLGEIRVEGTVAQSALLKVGRHDLICSVDFGSGDVRGYELENGVLIKEFA